MESQREYVGIDLHRRRSVIVRRNEAGETLDTVRIDNDPVVLSAELAKAGEHPEVILEATYGWLLGGRRLGRMRGRHPPGSPARQQLGPPADEERRPTRSTASSPASRGSSGLPDPCCSSPSAPFYW